MGQGNSFPNMQSKSLLLLLKEERQQQKSVAYCKYWVIFKMIPARCSLESLKVSPNNFVQYEVQEDSCSLKIYLRENLELQNTE